VKPYKRQGRAWHSYFVNASPDRFTFLCIEGKAVHDGGSRRVQGSDWCLSRLRRGVQERARMGYFYSASAAG
jgi:hypothetical protein